VAESDYHAAITALQQKIKAKQPPSTNPTTAKAQRHDGDDNHSIDKSLIIQQELLNECSNSLCKQIQKIVQPISDEAFHTYLSQYSDRYNYVGRSSHEHTMDTCSSHPTAESSSIHLAVEDVTFTDEELRDHAAMQRVQELRQQVRDKVQSLLSLRQSTIQRAISITERQVAVLSLSLHQGRNSSDGGHDTSHSQNDMDTDTSDHHRHHSQVTTKQLLEHHQMALVQMKESFMNLYEAIQNNNNTDSSSLSSSMLVEPTQLTKEYQNTIHVIERGLRGPTGISSTIEQAIRRRDYYHGDSNNIHDALDATMKDPTMTYDHNDDRDEMEEQKNDPEQTLFHLLCR
jgi:hypothetical protein